MQYWKREKFISPSISSGVFAIWSLSTPRSKILILSAGGPGGSRIWFFASEPRRQMSVARLLGKSNFLSRRSTSSLFYIWSDISPLEAKNQEQTKNVLRQIIILYFTTSNERCRSRSNSSSYSDSGIGNRFSLRPSFQTCCPFSPQFPCYKTLQGNLCMRPSPERGARKTLLHFISKTDLHTAHTWRHTQIRHSTANCTSFHLKNKANTIGNRTADPADVPFWTYYFRATANPKDHGVEKSTSTHKYLTLLLTVSARIS